MAHQAHSIPWTTLAENLQWRLTNKCMDDATDFHLRFKADQGKKLTHFVKAFARNVKNHADTERPKYPEYEAPSVDDVVIGEAAAEKISPTVYRWAEEKLDDYQWARDGGELLPPLSEKEQGQRRRTLPERERKMSAFTRKHKNNDCYKFLKVNKEGFYSIEVFKMLLLYGEMDTILRVCAHPENQLKSWWDQGPCYDVSQDAGWNIVALNALNAYMLLNVFYCFPEHWAEGCSRQRDYRNTRLYQRTVSQLSESGHTSDVPMYPHAQFFGIESGQFREYGEIRYPRSKEWEQRRPCGLTPYDDFLQCEKDMSGQGHVPTPKDVASARHTLCERGLPAELAQLVLNDASYTPRARLAPAHHPLHPDNREELRRYLTYCWQLMVRCEVVARAVGKPIAWDLMVAEAIVGLFQCTCRAGNDVEKRWYGFDYDENGERQWLFR